MRGNLIEAVTLRHRLEVTLKALHHLDARGDFHVNFSSVDKWCSIYPTLLSLIHIYVDLDQLGVCFSNRESRQRLCWHARDLAAQLAAEAREDKCERDSGSFLAHKTTENLLHQLKILRPQQRMQGVFTSLGRQ